MIIDKSDFVKTLAEASGVMQGTADDVLNTTLRLIEDALVRGDEVRFKNFGAFHAPTRAAGVSRNIRTGEAINVPERRVARFKPSVPLKKALMNGGT